MHTSSRISVALVFLATSFACLLNARSVSAQVADGTLIRAVDDTRVYYIDNEERRWVSSPDTLRLQGLTGPITVVTAAVRDEFPEGDHLNADSTIILPGEADVLPDLAPLAGSDLYLSTVNGRTVIRFTASFMNEGGGPLDLVTNGTTAQHIVHTDGSTRDKVVGTFVWHPAHLHYHFSDFADYVMEATLSSTGDTAQAVTQKTTFCMRDDEAVELTLPAAASQPVFTTCNQYEQGVSVGWADVYHSSLSDQYIDVNDLPPGVYSLEFDVDPRHHFVEQNQNNNTSSVVVNLDVANHVLQVLASGAPFESADNQFPDGMLVRGEDAPGIYLIEHNRKRLIRSEALFNAHGFSWNSVYWLPQGVVDAIPNAAIRLSGTDGIYLLNGEGYRRHLINPEVFASYGLTNDDVVDLDSDDFYSYPETDLVARAADDRVFSTSTKTQIGTLGSLSSDERASVHLINDTEFNAYAVQVVATGLDVPWDVAFLPDGDLIVTERTGTLRELGARPAVMPVPNVLETGEGGLMGIALHPDYAANHLVYLYFTTTDGHNRVARFKLENGTLTLDKTIIDGIPSQIYHDGGQLAFGPDGMLYITTGDASNTANAPDLGSLAGKTLRLTADGAIPSDNPFGTAIWSYGHRNAQGLAWDDQGRLWETEHGRSGTLSGYDELNLIQKGKNYGWPDSQGPTVLSGTIGPVLQSGADVTWAPSGIAFVDGKLYWAGLRGSSLYRATVQADGSVTDFQTRLTDAYGRLRAVVLGPDGALYVTTSNRDGRGTVRAGDDKILKINLAFF